MINTDKIKSFINHPEKVIRSIAVDYFVNGNLGNTEITHLILDACETYAEDRLHLIYALSKMPLDELALERIDKINTDDISEKSHINRAIINADLELLEKIGLIHDQNGDILPYAKLRYELHSMKTGELWDMLIVHCEEDFYAEGIEFDREYGEKIINELVTRSDFPFEAFDEMLELPMGEYNESGWIEIYLCLLARGLKYEKAIDFLLDRLKFDPMLYVYSEAIIALGNMGDAAVKSIKERYNSENYDFKATTIEVLGYIKTELCEEFMIELLKKEKDQHIKTSLCMNLCDIFSTEAIPLVMDVLEKGYDRQMTRLEKHIYTNHLINSLDNVNMDEWKKMIEEDDLKSKKAMENFKRLEESGKLSELMASLQNNLGGNSNYNDIDYSNTKPNNYCPCGSGKKYKKCCMK